MDYGFLYEIKNKLNGKLYIGVTFRSIEERWKEHERQALKGDKRHLYRSIRTYGIENFEIRMLMQDVPENFLWLLEMIWIKELNLTNPKYGYNLSIGGKINKGHRFKRPKEFSQARLGKGNSFYGKHHTEETKKIISDTNKGNSYALGCHRTEEVRRHLSEVKMGISTATKHTREIWNTQRTGKNNPSAKSVYMIDKNSNSILNKFDTMKEAIEWIIENTRFEKKVMRSMIGAIVRVCKGKTKTAYGYKWKYVEEGQTTIPYGSTLEDELPMEVQDIQIG